MKPKIDTEIRKLFTDLGMIVSVAITILICSTFALAASTKAKNTQINTNTTNTNVATQKNIYQEECGSCHMAYPSNFLPSASWNAILQNLENHFGDDATLDPETQHTINQHLTKNNANSSGSRRSRKIIRSMGLTRPNTPITRISEVPYIKEEHEDVKEFLASKNSNIKKLTQCDSCHEDAEQGLFDEDTVNIPNIGRWDD